MTGWLLAFVVPILHRHRREICTALPSLYDFLTGRAIRCRYPRLQTQCVYPIMNLMSQWLLGAGALLAIAVLFVIEYIGVDRAARRNAEAEAHRPKPRGDDATAL